MRGCSRQSGTLALPAYHGTERSRANAPSVKEKETPCVAAACRVAISVNSLVARPGNGRVTDGHLPLRQAWRQAVLACLPVA